MRDRLSCFHCGEDVAPGTSLTLTLAGRAEPMCCEGCKAAARFIRDAGLTDYYRFRDAPAPRPAAPPDDAWVTYDLAEVQDRFAATAGDCRSVNLLLEGIRCPACAWLVERKLEREAGVDAVAVNPATGRARLEWRPDGARLSALLRTIEALGYRPHVLGMADTLDIALRERRQALKRLAVAGIGMMQVMMFAVALYAGAFAGMDPVMKQYLRLVSMLVATPVLFYSGRPFMAGAWRSLRARQFGMDVPVTLALLLAYGASTLNTFAARGEVYFDSVTMFVFLLLLGRYAEMAARHHAGSTTDALARLQPADALRRTPDGGTERVPLGRLAIGDLLRVPPGEAFPVDGVLTEGATAADESLLTGESAPVAKRAGEVLIGGSVNVGGTAVLRVTALGHETVLAGIVRLLARAQTERPALARLADRWAAWFVAVVLLAALAVAVGWALADPARAFEATLAVLVVTCPCALSLATPAAVTAATSALARHGLLVTRADAIESLALATHVVLDKTGTLTAGRPEVRGCRTLGGLDEPHCLRIAAALEQASAHPIARAFSRVPRPLPAAAGLTVEPGQGLEGVIEGVRYRIGRRDFVAPLAGARDDTDAGLYLGRAGEWLAHLTVEDRLRPGAAAAVARLGQLGLSLEVASGDHAATVAQVAAGAGIARHHARLTPADKIALVAAHEAAGRSVIMVGDGINDAPVLAAANVSIAMGAGAALAQTSADAVLMTQDLDVLPRAIAIARRTLAVVRQNLGWAVVYNLTALPAAALGFIPPWAAAIGMSASSLLVVANAMRLRRLGRPAPVVPGASPAQATGAVA